MSGTVRRWGTFPSQDQVSLWLFEQPVIFFPLFSLGDLCKCRTRTRKSCPPNRSLSECGRDIPLRSARTQQQHRQSREVSPNHFSKRAAIARVKLPVRRCQSIAASRYSASPKLWKKAQGSLFQPQSKDFFLAWETLTAPPPRGYLQLWAHAALEHTLLGALTSSGGWTDAPAAAQVHIPHCSTLKHYFTGTFCSNPFQSWYLYRL